MTLILLLQFILLILTVFANATSNIRTSCAIDAGLSTALTKFSTSLFQATIRNANKLDNVIISPSSISSVLAIVMVGARGNTADQINRVLRLTNSEDDQSFSCVFKALNQTSKGRNDVTLKSVNRLLVSEDFRIMDSFRSTIQSRFDATAQNVNFSFPITLSTVNRQIEESTNYKIKNLIPQGSLDSSTKVVLLNAAYFKGNWLKAFNPAKSLIKRFYVDSNRELVPTKMMVSRGYFRIAHLNQGEARVLELPYSGSQIKMFIFLPNRYRGLARLESSLSPKVLNSMENRMKETLLDVTIPKFKFETSPDLKKILSSLGITDLFSNAADLSGISGSRELYVSDAFHRAFIEVNEKGTEAAAATVFRFKARSFRRPPIIQKFVADHPFIFLIRDSRTKMILFIGRFCKPQE